MALELEIEAECKSCGKIFKRPRGLMFDMNRCEECMNA